MAEVIVTKLERHEDTRRPYWTARIHNNGTHAEVDTRFGSWQATTPGGRREVLPPVAATLQARLPRRERRRR